MTPDWTDGIVGQITNRAATPNHALHLIGGACSVFVTCNSLVPRRQVSFVVRDGKGATDPLQSPTA
jgi:hypothetical protein